MVLISYATKRSRRNYLELQMGASLMGLGKALCQNPCNYILQLYTCNRHQFHWYPEVDYSYQIKNEGCPNLLYISTQPLALAPKVC